MWERRCIREFKRRLHHYAIHVPEEDRLFEWLALMQHHGAPTRLLDWTYLCDVAMFFALEQTLENRDSGPAVWMLNATWCKEVAIEKLVKEGGRGRDVLDLPIGQEDEPKLARELMADPPLACVFPLNPFRLNERLTLQKGVFLWTGDVRRSFEENVQALPGHESERNVVKFVLQRGAKANAIEELYDLNITRATLFPGLDGSERVNDFETPTARIYCRAWVAAAPPQAVKPGFWGVSR